MKKFELLVFITGAVTLSLEVLASRIMTPYFGVSLFIWSSILSITLTFLAIGYHFGGRLSRRLSDQSMAFAFLLIPVVSAASIGVSALMYPVVFPILSQTNLIFGSFVAASLLLALPLIGLSAMNPLLIGIQREKNARGDGGAGRIFFVSTVGSVVGVLVTAFWFIPNVTNFRAILMLGIFVSILSVGFTVLSAVLSSPQKRNIIVSGLSILLLSGLLLAGKDNYLKFISTLGNSPLVFEIRAEYTSMFGNIKIADVRRRDGTGTPLRYFLQDGLVQNRTNMNYVSVSMYTYVLESLTHIFAPDARDIVVLGLGAGIVPGHLKSEGLNVSVVEINRRALDAATNYFKFDQSDTPVHLEDARTFVRRCRNAFDVAVIDLYLGDGIPDYLMTTEFFGDLSRCVRSGGTVVMNALFEGANVESHRRLLATISTKFPRLFISGIPQGNTFIVGTSGITPTSPAPESSNMPPKIANIVQYAVRGIRPVPPTLYQSSKPVSDQQNVFSTLLASSSMAERRALVGQLPPNALVN